MPKDAPYFFHPGDSHKTRKAMPVSPRLDFCVHSLSGHTSYRKISWNLGAARFGFGHSNRSDIWQPVPPRCLSNVKAIRSLKHPISRLWDLAARRPSTWTIRQVMIIVWGSIRHTVDLESFPFSVSITSRYDHLRDCCHYSDITWASCRFKPPVTQLFVQ